MFYSRTQLQRATVNHAVVSTGTRYVYLLGLDKFTNYTIQVAAFTRIGYGALSSDSVVSTDEDGMNSSAPPFLHFQEVMMDCSELHFFFLLHFW